MFLLGYLLFCIIPMHLHGCKYFLWNFEFDQHAYWSHDPYQPIRFHSDEYNCELFVKYLRCALHGNNLNNNRYLTIKMQGLWELFSHTSQHRWGVCPWLLNHEILYLKGGWNLVSTKKGALCKLSPLFTSLFWSCHCSTLLVHCPHHSHWKYIHYAFQVPPSNACFLWHPFALLEMRRLGLRDANGATSTPTPQCSSSAAASDDEPGNTEPNGNRIYWEQQTIDGTTWAVHLKNCDLWVTLIAAISLGEGCGLTCIWGASER